MTSRPRAPFIVLILAAIFVAHFGESIYSAVFTNYLADIHHFKAADRGILEIPRELPGILCLFAVGALFFLKEAQIAAVSMILMGVGIAALGVPELSSSFWQVVVWIMVASLGQHIMMGVVDAIVMHTALPENRGLRLGQMKALATAAGLFGAFFVWLKWKFNSSYMVDFVAAGILCLLAGAILMRVKGGGFPEHKSWRDRFVFKRKYFKYYLLETLFGVRKQVYITFGFWLMVSTLERSPAFMGKTLLAAGVLGLAFQPFVGKMVQVFGERKVLVVDGILLALLCLVYAYSLELLPPSLALASVTACFILDNLLFCVGTARTTYIARICESKEDITPSIYTGIAINHAVSISCAVLGGLLWTKLGSHKAVFLVAGAVTLLSAAVASTIPPEGVLGAAHGREDGAA